MADAGTGREEPGRGAAAAMGPRVRRWAVRALVWGLWLGVLAAGAQVAVAWTWTDELAPVSTGRLLLHYFAFMAGTFALHAGVAALVAGMVAIALQRRLLAAVAIVVATAGVGPELNLRRAGTAMAADVAGESIKILSANMRWDLGDYTPLVELIERERPDVVLLQEWTPGAASVRRALAGTYPYAVELPRNDGFGQAVFSKRAFIDRPRLFPPVGRWTEPQIWFDIEFAGRPLRLANIHLVPPIWWGGYTTLRAGGAALTAWAGGPEGERPDVLMGDFNSARRSCIQRGLARAGYVEAHAAAGRGRGSTWPRRGLFRFAPGVRIDHAYVGPGLRVLSAKVSEDYGSDHAGVIVELARDR